MNNQTIVFGSGCFWCTEAVFQRLKGVEKAEVGYAGGETDSPTYQEVVHSNTGHAEVLRVVYNPDEVPFERLLDVFFATHDPTSLNRQGNDVGPQYRSVIYYTKDEQKQEIDKYMKMVEDEKVFKKPVVTEVAKLDKFYVGEQYHQNYYNNNREQGYCQFVIDPKIAKLREKFSPYLKEGA